MKFSNKSPSSLASKLLLGSAIAALPLFAAAQAQTGSPTVEEVVVTGTIIKGAGPTGSNLITVDRTAIADIGAVTVSQVLADIPGLNNFGSAGQGAQNSSDPGGASSPTIHSLGNSASNGTLILVDGHRLPYTGIQHNTIDPGSVPVIALQRVEVLPDGASATYGSDAVAGVVNFITRTNYSGLETNAQYGFADGYNTFGGSILGGHNWGSGSALIAYEYTSKSHLANGIHPYETARQDLRLGTMTAAQEAAFPGLSLPNPATPGTFASTTPVAGMGTTGPYGVAIPYPSLGSNLDNFNCPIATEKNNSGTTSTSYLYPYTSTSGLTNNTTNPVTGVCDENSYGTQLPSETRNTIFASFKQQLTNNVVVSADFDFSSRLETNIVARTSTAITNTTVYGPTQPLATYSPTTGLPTTSGVAAGQINPFYNVGSTGLSTAAIAVSYDPTALLANMPATTDKTGDTVAFANVGLEWDIGDNWTFKVGTTFGQDFDFDRGEHQLCLACAYLALNGTTNAKGTLNTTASTSAVVDPQGLSTVLSETRLLTASNALDVWNPAGPANRTSQTVIKQLVSGYSNTTATQGIQDANLQLGGSPFDLPAGPVKIAIGGEFLHTTDEQLQNSQSGALAPSAVASSTINLFYGRTVYAAFAEILAPIVSPEMNVPLVENFTLDMSGRVDQYTTYGGTKNPKVGFTWTVFDGLAGRGSYGTSFTVPAFASGGQNQTGITSQSALSSNAAPPVTTIFFNNATYNGGAGVSGTWVGSAPTCAAAGSSPVDVSGNKLAAPYTGAVGCLVNAAETGLQYAAGGRPGLVPETGTTYSVGFDFDAGKFADFLTGLTGEVTYYQAKYANMVTSIGIGTAQPGLTYFAPPGGWAPTDPFITSREASYPLTTTIAPQTWFFFDGRQANAYSLWQNGLDYGIQYNVDTDYGHIAAGINGNEILRFTQQNEGVNQPLINIMNGNGGSSGRFAGQQTTFRTTLNWSSGSYKLGLAFNFQSAFWAQVTSFPYNLVTHVVGGVVSPGWEHVSPLETVDLNASYIIPGGIYTGLTGMSVNLNVTNLLDSDPPFQDVASGMGAGSQLGRLITVSLKKSF